MKYFALVLILVALIAGCERPEHTKRGGFYRGITVHHTVQARLTSPMESCGMTVGDTSDIVIADAKPTDRFVSAFDYSCDPGDRMHHHLIDLASMKHRFCTLVTFSLIDNSETILYDSCERPMP